jgi:hypothetical protein
MLNGVGACELRHAWGWADVMPDPAGSLPVSSNVPMHTIGSESRRPQLHCDRTAPKGMRMSLSAEAFYGHMYIAIINERQARAERSALFALSGSLHSGPDHLISVAHSADAGADANLSSELVGLILVHACDGVPHAHRLRLTAGVARIGEACGLCAASGQNSRRRSRVRRIPAS